MFKDLYMGKLIQNVLGTAYPSEQLERNPDIFVNKLQESFNVYSAQNVSKSAPDT